MGSCVGEPWVYRNPKNDISAIQYLNKSIPAIIFKRPFEKRIEGAHLRYITRRIPYLENSITSKKTYSLYHYLIFFCQLRETNIIRHDFLRIWILSTKPQLHCHEISSRIYTSQSNATGRTIQITSGYGGKGSRVQRN